MLIAHVKILGLSEHDKDHIKWKDSCPEQAPPWFLQQPILTCAVLLGDVVIDANIVHRNPAKVAFSDFTLKNHLTK